MVEAAPCQARSAAGIALSRWLGRSLALRLPSLLLRNCRPFGIAPLDPPISVLSVAVAYAFNIGLRLLARDATQVFRRA